MADPLDTARWSNRLIEVREAVKTDHEFVDSIVNVMATRTKDEPNTTHIDVITDLDNPDDRHALGRILDSIKQEYSTPQMHLRFSQYTLGWYKEMHPDVDFNSDLSISEL